MESTTDKILMVRQSLSIFKMLGESFELSGDFSRSEKAYREGCEIAGQFRLDRKKRFFTLSRHNLNVF